VTKVSELASNKITASKTITVELIEANETPAVVIVRWPSKPSVIHPHRFPAVAGIALARSRPLRYGWQRSNEPSTVRLRPADSMGPSVIG
jgi:hypothetical protein